jgi:hypothetical protein
MNESPTFIRAEESLAAFRKYEVVLCEAIKAHKQGKAYYVMPPPSMAPQTFVVRVRDVIRGGIKHDHTFTVPLYSSKDLVELKKDNVVRVLKDGRIYIGPQPTASTQIPIATTVTYEAELPDIIIATREQLEKVFALISDRCLKSCRVILESDLRADIDALLPIYDIAIEWQSDNSFVLV